MTNFKAYANSFQEKSRLGLESIGALCQKCNNPQDSLRFIHIAGTNGKGSVCAFLQCILTESGLKTGKFISPNMINATERISIDGQDITEAELDDILGEVEGASLKVQEEKGVIPTQFEIWTAAAFLYFKRHNCDIVVLETGLGGRLDATNIIKNPLMCVITKIDVDHTEYLGDTIEKIAFEKAGIIKPDCKVISSVQEESVADILKKAAQKCGCKFMVAPMPADSTHQDLCECFSLPRLKNLKINLAGVHQTQNASIAAAAAMELGIREEFIRSGLLKARNIGRFEKIAENPTVIFDGAHNKSGTQALINAIERYFRQERITLIYGAMADKDTEGSLQLLKNHKFADRSQVLTVTVKDNPRSETAKNLKEKFEAFGFSAEGCENIHSALKKAIEIGNTVVICGSLYLYKDLKG